MKYITKKKAKEVLDTIKEEYNTSYFDRCVSFSEIHYMLRHDLGLKSQETYAIIAALVLAGAKITTEDAE